jgi:uncharacterized protein YbjQ (UPF0145 family)
MKQIAAIVLALALTACATSHVLVGRQRAPIPVESVRVYLEPPATYEQVAILESSSEGAFALTAQQKTDAVMRRLKEEAASLGANGILIQGLGTEQRGAVMTSSGNFYGSGYVGTGVAVPVMVKAGSALAIYVPDQPAAPSAVAPTSLAPAEQPVPKPAECKSCQRIGRDW